MVVCLPLMLSVSCLFMQKMSENTSKPNDLQPPVGAAALKKPAALKKIKFTVYTYPDLQPFLEMAIVLLEGLYEHMSTAEKQ